MLRTVLNFLLLLSSSQLHATPVDTGFLHDLAIKIKQYDESQGFQGLYLHLDKTSYVKGENIWFTAYQLRPVDTTENTLFVVLQQTDADTIVSVSRYILHNGIGKGYLYLNDSLPGGAYRLLAYTNDQLGHPGRKVFQQAFKLESEFREKYSLVRTSVKVQDKDNYLVSYKLIGEDGSSAGDKKLKYILRSRKEIIAEDRLKLSSSGEWSMIVPAQYKDSLLTLSALNISGKGTEKFTLPLWLDQGLKVFFYPESGHLLEGVPNKMAFEIRSRTDKPLALQGTILEDGVPVAKIEGNNNGRGYFTMTPSYGKVYTLKLETGQNYAYDFPEVDQRGALLSVENAVAKDSVTITVRTRKTGNNFSLILHNYRQIFDLKEIAFSGDTYRLQLPLQDAAPEGVLTLTLLDENKKPVAERCVYRQPIERPLVQIATDRSSYPPRTKVKLRVKFQDAAGNSIKGFFSIGCVANNHINRNALTSLPAFYYAGQHLPSSDQLIHDFNSDNTSAIEIMLLTQFWTKYRWQKMLDHVPDDYDQLVDKVTIRFLYRDKPATRKIHYAFSKGDELQLLETDNSGQADLDYKQLRALPDQTLGFVALGSREGVASAVKQYQLITGFSTINQLSWQTALNNKSHYWQQNPRDTFVLKGKNILKEVKVVSRKEESPRNEFVSVTCRDYVCLYNVLNCKNHLTGSTPVDGQRYLYLPTTTGMSGFRDRFGEVIYKGCGSNEPVRFLAIINATWQHKEFYVINYEQEQLNTPQTRSTLFWSHQVITNDDGEAELEFFTNDLPGNYSIHLQGFSSKGPVSALGAINVERP